MRFQIKRDREHREREIHPLIAREVWCGFGMELWSGPAWPTLTAETLGSTGAHPDWQREREGWREKERQAVITKTTTVWFRDGSLGENRWVIRSGCARCCIAAFENLFYTCVTVQPSVTEMWSTKLEPQTSLPLNGRSEVSASNRFLFLRKDTLENTWTGTWSNWSSCAKPLSDNELFPTQGQRRGVRRGVRSP